MNSATFRFLTMIAVLSLLSIGLLQGQTAVTGGIEGNVTDSSGAAIVGATVVRLLRSGYLAGYAQANRDIGLALGLYESDLHA